MQADGPCGCFRPHVLQRRGDAAPVVIITRQGRGGVARALAHTMPERDADGGRDPSPFRDWTLLFSLTASLPSAPSLQTPPTASGATTLPLV